MGLALDVYTDGATGQHWSGPARMKRLIRALQHRVRSLIYDKAERRHSLVGSAAVWKMKRDFQIQFLKDMKLKPEHYLLDLGSGTLRGGIPLIGWLQDGHYFGVEVRARALEEGRKELREAGLEGKNPTLLLSPDISRLTIDRTFDYVWAFSVLIHMTDEILDDTLAFVAKHLSDQGVFYANVNIGDNSRKGRWRGFPVVWRSFEFYSQACANNGLRVIDLGSLRSLGHVSKAKDRQRMLSITKS